MAAFAGDVCTFESRRAGSEDENVFQLRDGFDPVGLPLSLLADCRIRRIDDVM
jgi:hypothetical protein